MGGSPGTVPRVLELRSVRGTGGGPEKTILLGSARTDPRRVLITICYIRDARDAIFSVDAKASALPVNYVEARERHSFDPTSWRTVRRIVQERQIDIVHAHDYKANLIAFWLAKTEGVTPLSTSHGWTGHTWRERLVYYPGDRLLLSRFPRVIAVSSDIAQALTRSGAKPERIVTILNGIDHEMFRRDRGQEADQRRALGLSPSNFVIGSVGRLEPQKRFDLLIDAVADLRVTRPEIRLVLVGEGSLRSDLEARARARLPSNSCLLLGHRTDIPELHHAFDLFVQSSTYEGTPNAVLEAMALETPVVATDVGGTAELVRSDVDGLIIPAGDVSAIVGAVRRALTDPEATAARAAAARRRVEVTLSFENRMRSVENVYLELMKDRRARAGVQPALLS